MMFATKSLVLLLLYLFQWSYSWSEAPVIGIVSVPIENECVTIQDNQFKENDIVDGSCFHSLYVQWLQSAGAKVVPIPYDSSQEKLDSLFSWINGILFTGGEANIKDIDSQYNWATGYLLNKTIIANTENDYFPIWATCMGMQLLCILRSDPDVLSSDSFDSEEISLPLHLAPEAETSRLLRNVPHNMMTWLQTENITTNLHHDGIKPENFNSRKELTEFFTILSTNLDRKGKSFVSTIEGKTIPVYGAQWHPERPQFEWSPGGDEHGIAHTPHAISTMQWMSNFFVSEARKNQHEFPTSDLEAKHLIYNWKPVGTTSYQAYIFPKQ